MSNMYAAFNKVSINKCIPDGMPEGWTLVVDFCYTPQSERLGINLQCGPTIIPRDDVGLHIEVNFSRPNISFNSIIQNTWGIEEHLGSHFPFLLNKSYTIYIVNRQGHFQITFRAFSPTLISHHSFYHRIPTSRISNVTIDGDPHIELVQMIPNLPLPLLHNYSSGHNLTHFPVPPSYRDNMYQNPIPPSHCVQSGRSYYPQAQQSIGFQPPPVYPTQPPPVYPTQPPPVYPTQPPPVYPTQPGAPPLGYAQHPSFHNSKKNKKIMKKAMKFGLPIAAAGVGAYALKKTFRHHGGRSSSSSSSSSSSDSD